MINLTTEEFIAKAKFIHGNRYDYSESIFINTRTKLSILCVKHGYFNIKASKHLIGQKCNKCSREDIKLKSSLGITNFIKNSNLIHNNFYNYSEVDYKNQFTKVKIICPLHGEFFQTPKNHRRNKCPKCAEKFNQGYSKNRWIEQAKIGKVLKLYFIRCWDENEEFYKIGLTCKSSIKDRFHGNYKMPYNYEIINEIQGNVDKLYNMEINIKKEIRQLNVHYIPLKKFNGSTHECFKGNFTPKFV